MFKQLIELGSPLTRWSNENQGVLAILIFVVTLFIAWTSGIFTALRRKPKFKIRLLPGPTFSCTFLTGKKHSKDNIEYDVHCTAVALYLNVTNVGAAPSSIANIALAYHWNLVPFSWLWLKNTVGWFWLYHQAIILTDFHVYIGKQAKGYPFLIQRSMITGHTAETFLESGRSTNGVVYFEQSESYGGCYPKEKNAKVKIKVRLTDAFGRHHTSRFKIDSVSLEAARKYNPAFGSTFSELHGES
jgi:hypothetical protein